MHDQVQRQPLAIDLHRSRIDQEWHVVVDDLDDRVARRPAVLAGNRVDHADLRLVRFAPLGELPVRQQRAVQVLDVARRDVLRVDPLEVARRERQQARSARRARRAARSMPPRRTGGRPCPLPGNSSCACLRFLSRAVRLVSGGTRCSGKYARPARRAIACARVSDRPIIGAYLPLSLAAPVSIPAFAPAPGVRRRRNDGFEPDARARDRDRAGAASTSTANRRGSTNGRRSSTPAFRSRRRSSG